MPDGNANCHASSCQSVHKLLTEETATAEYNDRRHRPLLEACVADMPSSLA